MPSGLVSIVGGASNTTTSSGVVGDGLSEQYLPALQALLPSGPAWTREPGATLTDLLRGLGLAFERVERRAVQLVEESDPRMADELLAEWEAAAGLTASGSDAARRAAVVARVLARGGANRAFFEELAAALGYTIARIDRYHPFVAGSPAGASLTQGGWVFVWDVVTTSAAADAELEALFRAHAPAHTLVRFVYE